MMNTTAQAIAPGPVHASATVPAMQITVDQASTVFFAACAAAHAPRSGPITITIAYETESAAVHANVAHSALAATTATKYALKTAVRTTVVYPELAKSYIAHAHTSRRATPGFSAEAAGTLGNYFPHGPRYLSQGFRLARSACSSSSARSR